MTPRFWPEPLGGWSCHLLCGKDCKRRAGKIKCSYLNMLNMWCLLRKQMQTLNKQLNNWDQGRGPGRRKRCGSQNIYGRWPLDWMIIPKHVGTQKEKSSRTRPTLEVREMSNIKRTERLRRSSQWEGRSQGIWYPGSLSRLVFPGGASHSSNCVKYCFWLRNEHWILKVIVHLDKNRLVE